MVASQAASPRLTEEVALVREWSEAEIAAEAVEIAVEADRHVAAAGEVEELCLFLHPYR